MQQATDGHPSRGSLIPVLAAKHVPDHLPDIIVVSCRDVGDAISEGLFYTRVDYPTIGLSRE